MRFYRWVRGGIPLFLVAVFVVGYAALLAPGYELFPFYSWSMFGMVPEKTAHYRVLLIEVPGHPLPAPVEFDRGDGMVSDPHSVVAYRVILELGRAIDRQDADAESLWRRHFESHYLSVGTRYEVVRDVSTPEERWRGLPSETKILHLWKREP